MVCLTLDGKKMRRKEYSGFTLIELLVVMSIIALLLTIALPRYFGALDKSKDAVLKENLQTMRITIDRYHADKGHYPDDLGELVQNQYLRAIPVDPITESSQTWLLIPAPSSGTTGIYDVRSGSSGISKDGKPYAQF